MSNKLGTSLGITLVGVFGIVWFLVSRIYFYDDQLDEFHELQKLQFWLKNIAYPFLISMACFTTIGLLKIFSKYEMIFIILLMLFAGSLFALDCIYIVQEQGPFEYSLSIPVLVQNIGIIICLILSSKKKCKLSRTEVE